MAKKRLLVNLELQQEYALLASLSKLNIIFVEEGKGVAFLIL